MDLSGIVASHPDGISKETLLGIARETYPDLTLGQLEAELEMAEGTLVVAGDTVHLRGTAASHAPPAADEPEVADAPTLRRLVAVDLETILRYTEHAPQGERTIFQVGAIRFGPDTAWAASPSFDRYLRVPDELRERIVKPELRATVETLGDDPAAVLDDLLEYIDEADAIVAYNGRTFDFPLLDEAISRHSSSKIPTRIRRIDGLYVAVAVWPVPPRAHTLSHLITSERLAAIRKRLEIDLTGLVAHDAADDSRMLAELMRFAAAQVQEWSPELRGLVRSVGHASDAWAMVFSLGAIAPEPRMYDAGEVRDILAASLVGKDPLRPPVPEAEDAPPPIPTETGQLDLSRIASAGGRVDIDRLVRMVKGERASVRTSQRQMVEAMRGWVDSGIDALVEAPTGTGKSYAILAVALEWLAADPHNRVVMSTFTRQLQAQLANDIFELYDKGGVPGLIEMTSLVKGASNRLSLAGLIRACADSTVPPVKGRRRRRGEFVGDPMFAELALYLALRLRAQGTPVDEWEAHSVDPVDIEPFFDGYLRTARGGALRSRFLKYLSQADSREFALGEASPAEHTSLVKEVLGERRLVVTNHALLFAHLEDFTDRDRTLVIVDEAHSLESAATGALEREVDFGVLLDALAELREWMRPPAADASDEDRSRYAGLRAAVRDLDGILDVEHVQLMATKALDSMGRDPLHPEALRVVTLASPVSDTPTLRAGFIRTFEDLAHKVNAITAAMRVQPGRADRFEDERRAALVDRFATIADAGIGVIGDLTAITAPADPLGQPANRVVWLEELARGRGPGDLRFRVRSAPIELSREDDYVRFTTAFARTYYISATLKVDGSFGFMRERLALTERVSEIELPTPFDLERQARLIAFTDFPSWAEQEEAAVRSVAHQVGRYLSEVGERGRNGAMVLTTSKNAANRIYEETIRVRGDLGGEYAISSAGYLGTARAVEDFKDRGGALVGTKGLWQGVDIADPERLRIVWVNKLPFAPFADPLVVARRELVRRRAELDGEADPDGYAVEHYYLPLAAMELRQAVGRLIRSSDHRGVVVISDRKLGGPTRLHRRYRQVFLGSLAGFVRDDEVWGPGGGNLFTMADGWREIWRFLADAGEITADRLRELTTADALDVHTVLPETLEIRRAGLTFAELAVLEGQGPDAVRDEVLARAQRVAGLIRADATTELFDYQREAIAALADGRDVLTILPTSAGKSFIFQLPALVMPGVTIVVSPLVALMTDQALGLNRSIGGAVRALVAPMRESNSRTGKTQVAEQLTGVRDHGIRIVYVSPERLAQRQFQDWILKGVERGIVRRIAVDEAHTFATWGDDFRPSFLRAERFLARLRTLPNRPRFLALTATATPSVRKRLHRAIFGLPGPNPAVLTEVIGNPIRPELALYRKMLGAGEGGAVMKQRLLDALIEASAGHTIIYTLTIKEARRIHAALLEHVGEGARHRIRLFHGRLTAVEKEAIAGDFHSAPEAGDEEFEPMVIVATAAFGLGVDRKDIRTVIVASPPSDLAGLYQEIGRGGRDKHDSVGIMIGSGRAFGTLAFMDRMKQHLDFAAVQRIAALILSGDGPFDADQAAEDLLNLGVASGQISQAEAAKPETVGNFRTSVIRVLAHLADAGCLDDRGDFPETVRIVLRDDRPDADPEMAVFLDAIVAALDGRKDVPVLELAERLAPAFPEEADDPGDLWVQLLELHSLGYLDVSQQPNKRMLTSLRRLQQSPPAGFVERFARSLERDEREELVRFFSRKPKPTCVNDDFRAYFEVPSLPDGTCATDTRRCSGCWLHGHPGEKPAILRSLADGVTRAPKPSDAERKAIVARAARNAERLLRIRYWGIHPMFIAATLRGQDTYFSKRRNKVVPLYPELIATAVFGSMPSLRREDIDAALEALVAGGRARVVEGNKVRLVDHIANDEIRAARAAAKLAADVAKATRRGEPADTDVEPAPDAALEGEMDSLWAQAEGVPEGVEA